MLRRRPGDFITEEDICYTTQIRLLWPLLALLTEVTTGAPSLRGLNGVYFVSSLYTQPQNVIQTVFILLRFLSAVRLNRV